MEATTLSLSPCLDSGPDTPSYRLRGIVYFGSAHFVSRFVTLDGSVWYHDGLNGSGMQYEGEVHQLDDLMHIGSKVATFAFYSVA
jgi:hypothetical protein